MLQQQYDIVVCYSSIIQQCHPAVQVLLPHLGSPCPDALEAVHVLAAHENSEPVLDPLETHAALRFSRLFQTEAVTQRAAGPGGIHMMIRHVTMDLAPLQCPGQDNRGGMKIKKRNEYSGKTSRATNKKRPISNEERMHAKQDGGYE